MPETGIRWGQAYGLPTKPLLLEIGAAVKITQKVRRGRLETVKANKGQSSRRNLTRLIDNLHRCNHFPVAVRISDQPQIFSEMLFKNGAFKEGIHQRTPLDEETSRMTREEMYSGWIVCKDEGIKGMTS